MPVSVQSVVLPRRSGPWSNTIALPQVDPALGIQSFALSLAGTVDSIITITNLDLLPVSFASDAAGAVVLSRPDGSVWLQAAPTASIRATLQPGAPALLYEQATATASVGYTPAITGSADAALLVGTGTVPLAVSASARIHAVGPGNMEAQFTSLTSAEISLTAATITKPSGNYYGGGVIGQASGYWPGFPMIGSSTRSQTRTAAMDTVGASSTLAFDAFDPSLGVLDAVTVSTTAAASGSARLENLAYMAGAATLAQAASITVQGADGRTLATSGTSFSTTRQLSAFDGFDDFNGASAATFESTGRGAGSSDFLQGAWLEAFQSGPVALTVARGGNTTLDGPGNLHMATALQAGADVTVTYHFREAALYYTNTATGQSGTVASAAYAGPVAGLQRQFAWSSPDGVAIATNTTDIFLHGGAGSDALAVSRGSNVLDGGGGSNFLVGTTGLDGGHDTFFLDARGGEVTWSTLVNFGAGDSATLFGFHAGRSALSWTASDGAAGYRGLTIHSETNGSGTGVDASLTFAGVDQATADAHWSITTGTLAPGTADAADYLLIQWQ